MRLILKSLMVGAALLTAGTASAQRTRTLAPGGWAEWSAQRQPNGAVYRSGNLTLTFRRGPGSTSEEVHPQLVVAMRGMAPVTVTGENTMPAFAANATVGRWSADGTPFVMFQTFTGGAHCCTSTQVVYPERGRLRVVDLGLADGAPGGETPRDQDGDGLVDFLDRDNAFLYAFSSYASSAAPTTVTNIVHGRVVDVSTKPSFRHYHEELARETRRECADRTNNDRNGSCAAFVAASARLGRYDQAMAEVGPLWERNPALPWPSGCRVAQGEEGCPEAQQIAYPDFPTALRAFLMEHGYIPAVR